MLKGNLLLVEGLKAGKNIIRDLPRNSSVNMLASGDLARHKRIENVSKGRENSVKSCDLLSGRYLAISTVPICTPIYLLQIGSKHNCIYNLYDLQHCRLLLGNV